VSRRRDDLTFKDHAEVAALPAAEADSAMAAAVSKLRDITNSIFSCSASYSSARRLE
jgi:hypothetical protein